MTSRHPFACRSLAEVDDGGGKVGGNADAVEAEKRKGSYFGPVMALYKGMEVCRSNASKRANGEKERGEHLAKVQPHRGLAIEFGLQVLEFESHLTE